MSYEEFYELLPKDGWFLDGIDIRRHGDNNLDQCPLTAAAGFSGTAGILNAADKLNLTREQARDIVWAADGNRTEVRVALLARLGLEERP